MLKDVNWWTTTTGAPFTLNNRAINIDEFYTGRIIVVKNPNTFSGVITSYNSETKLVYVDWDNGLSPNLGTFFPPIYHIFGKNSGIIMPP